MKRPLLLLLVTFISFQLSAQTAADTGFAGQKYSIDTLVKSIDDNKMMTHVLAAGKLVYGDFKANCYYVVGSGVISKMECFFVDTTAGRKLIYYNKENEPVRMIDKNVSYYCAGKKLFYADGKPVRPHIARDIIFFMEEMNKMMMGLME
jgi:hypothetical protein